MKRLALLSAAVLAASCASAPPSYKAGDHVSYRHPGDSWASDWTVRAVIGPATLRIESDDDGEEVLVLNREVSPL